MGGTGAQQGGSAGGTKGPAQGEAGHMTPGLAVATFLGICTVVSLSAVWIANWLSKEVKSGDRD